ncbi:hypothetical protein N0V92_000247 [Colletotrichum tropicale]|nr:hypothetical protein N0V92_000247 [Colletotrichum tropicale]
MKSLGIDLGTTFTCAFTASNGVYEAVNLSHGSRIFRSTVQITNGKWTVKRPEDTAGGKRTHLSLAKRLIGRTIDDGQLVEDASLVEHSSLRDYGASFLVGDEMILPEEVSGFILARIRSAARNMDPDINLDGCVLAVPAYFTHQQREATLDAAEIAGFERPKVKLVPEPLAALVAFIGENQQCDRCQQVELSHDGNWFVIDIGGGTADVTVANVDQARDAFVVIASAGDNSLGGIHFDKELFALALRILDSKWEDLLSAEECDMSQVNAALERAKEELSDHDCTDLTIKDMKGDYYEVTITRAEAEEAWRGTVNQAGPTERVRHLFRRALDLPNIGDIKNVLIAGGTGSMPCIKSVVTEMLPEAAIHVSHLSEAVGRGAAYISNNPDVKITEVTPRAIGISCDDGDMAIILQRNKPVPITMTRQFFTPSDNVGTLQITLLEGEDLQASRNILLGDFFVEDIPPCPAETVVDVTIDIPQLGVVVGSARLGDMASASSLPLGHTPRHTQEELQRLKQLTMRRLDGTTASQRAELARREDPRAGAKRSRVDEDDHEEQSRDAGARRRH